MTAAGTSTTEAAVPADGARTRVPGRPIAWFVVLGAGIAVLQTLRIATSNRVGAPSMFVDDAYYYFKIAQHVVAGDGSTFDGISHTNGYHPLWLIVLIPVFAIVHSRNAALTVVKALCGALWIATLWQVGRIGRAAGASVAMWIGCLPIAIYAALSPRSLPFAGVETGLVLPLLLAAIVPLVRAAHTAARDEWIAGGWLAIAVLARLDAVYVVGFLALLAAVRATEQRGLRRVLALVRVGVPGGAVFVADMVVNRIWFGAALTTATRAKTMTPPTANNFPLHQYFNDPASMPIIVGVGTASGLVALAALVATRLARGDHARRAPLIRLAEVVAALWLAGALSTLVFDRQSSWALYPWYYYEAFLVLLLGPGVVIAALAPDLRIPSLSRRVLLIATGATVIAGAVIGSALQLDANGSENFLTQNAAAAMALNHVLPKNAVVAMGDRAGVVGYFLDRPVVQLEGIANSNEFLDAVQHGHAHAFLRGEHVAYYIKSADLSARLLLEHNGGPDPGAQECGFRFEPYFGGGNKVVFNVCQRDIVFATPIAKGEQLVVWRYRGGADVFHVPG
ncbi:MAG TPA: hypothetical protein VGO03_09875 [Acidimicrobiia bacterium]